MKCGLHRDSQCRKPFLLLHYTWFLMVLINAIFYSESTMVLFFCLKNAVFDYLIVFMLNGQILHLANAVFM